MRSLRAPGATESNETHFERPEVAGEYATFDFLLPPERAVLEELEATGALAGARILDLGVGGGRTTAWLASRCRSYVGIDISAAMISACRSRFSATGSEAPALLLADARFLPVATGTVDVALFTFSGLDGIADRLDRERALREIRRACRPGATFLFSSDNLGFAIRRASVRWMVDQVRRTWFSRATVRLALRHPTRLGEHLGRPLRWRLLNGSPRRIGASDHAVLVVERYRHEMLTDAYRSPGERIRLPGFHVRPRAQVEQLRRIGFDDVRVLTPRGVDVTADVDSSLDEHMWLYYACRAAERAR